MQYWKAVKKTEKRGVYATGGRGGSRETFFKVGETYEVEGDPVLCENGFHFWRADDFCFGYDYFGSGTVFLEVEPMSEVVSDTFKCVSTKIRVVRYVPVEEWKPLLDEEINSGNNNSGNYNSGNKNSGTYNSGTYNSGDYNSGNNNSGNYNSGHCNSGNNNSGTYNSGNNNSGGYNSGDYNSGHCNSGHCNSGHYNSGNYNSGNNNSGNKNSGDYNSGHCNSGDYNSGHCNSGNYNSGDYNSGNYNSGDYNSGYYNSGDYNSGYYNSGDYNSGNGYNNKFCTETKHFLFDVEVSKENYDSASVCMTWFDLENKTYKEAWAECPGEILKKLADIPEFKATEAREKFKEITGLDLPSSQGEDDE